ncbi:type II secretion system protein [Alteromonas facilis]|uniref:type II secretion system protein n=1 Tax=Alteromonas facilis TaxID=2048004 RepID=UPI000C292372|nr:type II secretion system protein [Alteromonas facilis]
MNSHSSLSRCQKHGFTLVEILVVLSLMAMLISLVGPFAVKTLDNAEARSELLRARLLIKHWKERSFLTHQSIRITLSGQEIRIEGESGKELNVLGFRQLRFATTTLKINALGFLDQTEVHYAVDGKENVWVFDEKTT